MTNEEKDKVCFDEVLSLYLRDVSKSVNEAYYHTVIRFALLYRECMNVYGWLKRRDHYIKAGVLEQDYILNRLKIEEGYNEQHDDSQETTVRDADKNE